MKKIQRIFWPSQFHFLISEKAKLEKEVENAKTDEEIAAIVDVVVTANNSKLHIN